MGPSQFKKQEKPASKPLQSELRTTGIKITAGIELTFTCRKLE